MIRIKSKKVAFLLFSIILILLLNNKANSYGNVPQTTLKRDIAKIKETFALINSMQYEIETNDKIEFDNLNDDVVEIESNDEIENLIPVEVLYSSNVKTYMSYSLITNKSSPQYDYIYNQNMVTVHDDGFLRTEDGYLGVALGSYFGVIGNKFIFELDTGNVLKLVKIDEKDDKHTNNGFIHKLDFSVIEFVIDTSKMKDKIYENGYIYGGNFNNCDDFSGKITNIWKIKINLEEL